MIIHVIHLFAIRIGSDSEPASNKGGSGSVVF